MAEKGIKNSLEEKYEYLGPLFKNKKFRVGLVVVLLLAVIIMGAWVRTLNMPLLEDSTTGEKIPLALDPYWFLRIAETKLERGQLPEDDNMRFPSAQIGWTNEILPDAVILMYNVGRQFDQTITLNYIHIISPVVFFVLGLIAFFFFTYFLTNSKWIALVSSTLLAFIPAYLYRTMAGFADHESPGMFAFFLLLAIFTLAMKYLDKDGKKSIYKIGLFSLAVGFLSAFTIASWGGIGNYAFMIIPLSFLVFWIIKNQDELKGHKKEKFILFYLIWFISTVLFSLVFGFGAGSVVDKYILSGQGAITPFVLGFMIIDYILIWVYKNREEWIPESINKERFRPFVSLVGAILLGIIGLIILKGGFVDYILAIIQKLIRPSGTGRLGLTVAENRAPFLSEWRNNAGGVFFWIFYLGIFLVGTKIAEGIKGKKEKIVFSLSWLILISGILFSRISRNHILNGTNFISQIVYFGAILIFLGSLVWVYTKTKIGIKSELMIVASWLFFMLISGRGAVRQFFLIAPFICFAGAYSIKISLDYALKYKDEILTLLMWAIFIFALVGTLVSAVGYYQSSKKQAERTGPSANRQWQRTNEWIRENTKEGSIFVHWWDYGYWIQTLGNRPTVTDGGHRVGFWDHLVGRYLLTTPRPETALSFMKAHNVSYLLIDQTDLGKYGAYSSIGSGPDREDRKSQISIMNQVPEQTRETANGTKRIYQGGVYVDKDIIYEKNGERIFLKKNKDAVLGVEIETINKDLNIGNQSVQGMEFKQPIGIFRHNGKQVRVPLKYVYYEGEIKEFDSGIDAIARILPKFEQRGESGTINKMGSVIYLSPLTSKSLFARLYLMEDPFDQYPTVEIAHKQPSPYIQMLNQRGAKLNDFVIYGGFRGPKKIWNVSYPDNIIAREEFLREGIPPEGYGSLDDLQFIKE